MRNLTLHRCCFRFSPRLKDYRFQELFHLSGAFPCIFWVTQSPQTLIFASSTRLVYLGWVLLPWTGVLKVPPGSWVITGLTSFVSFSQDSQLCGAWCYQTEKQFFICFVQFSNCFQWEGKYTSYSVYRFLLFVYCCCSVFTEETGLLGF